MTAQDNARKAIPLLAECAVCSEHASEDSQAHPLDELRMSPDNEPYCLNCWDQLPREDVGPWSEAETLEHYLNTPSPPSSAGEREVAWLIEGPDRQYLSVFEYNRTFIWTKDHAEALRFSRQFDAGGAMCVAKTFQPELFDGGVWERTKPVEHMWVAPPRAAMGEARKGLTDTCGVCSGSGETGTAYTLHTEGYARDKQRMEEAGNIRQRCWNCAGTGKKVKP